MEKEKLETLLASSRENNRIAQELIYKEYFLPMVKYVKTLVKDEHESVSIVNDGFLKAFAYLGSFSASQGSFKAWLKKVITNVAFDHIRRKKQSIAFAELNEDTPVTDNNHSAYSVPEGFHKLIEKLPSLSRSVFSLSMEGYSHREISEMLQISEVSSRWYYSQAKKKIKQYLE